MSSRSSIAVVGFFIFLFLAGSVVFINSKNKAKNIPSQAMNVAEPDAVDQDEPLMTPVVTPVDKDFSDWLQLNMFEAVNDLSLCEGDDGCINDAKRINSWLCAAGVCDEIDKSKKPMDCFEMFSNKYPNPDQIDESICLLIKFSSAETRRALLVLIAGSEDEDDLVEYGAYLFALKGSAVACEEYIKNYLGAYGDPQWKKQWYRALSGCRILAHATTREQEERDLYTWFGFEVEPGLNKCENIVNREIRRACNTPGVILPVYGQ